ncbi:MAG: hypothetical protein Q4A58_01775 [Fusobacterium sp.]|uniref:hypothetical protein n=1 Tax=Fusobacterium sp. TaxID=68766 RepID=UPI0026DAD3D2|nr:hypothetical protein [Fusobacterium sp.]MDO4690014.1 hypothetical protein [Fusobacterium sp.]
MFIILLFQIILVLSILLWVKRKFIRKINLKNIILLIGIAIALLLLMNYILLIIAFYLDNLNNLNH